MNPWPVILWDKPSLKLVLPSTTTIKWINTTKPHYQEVYLPQLLYYRASGGYSLFPSSLSSSSCLQRTTYPLLPPWPPESPSSFFYKVVCCTGYRHMSDVDTGASWPPPPPGSTLAVSLKENRISEDDRSDDAALRWLKFSEILSLSCSSLYSGISYTPSLICYRG